MQPTHWPIRELIDIVKARRHGRELALTLGFSLPEATKIAVVISELAREILENGQAGTISLTPHAGKETRLEILAHIQGLRPGDSGQAGSSLLPGSGAGLRGAERLADEFERRAVDGGGTAITAVKWLR